MLRIGEQHSSKCNVDGNEESMETITPIAKGMIASSWGAILSIIAEKHCGRHMTSIIMVGWSRTRCALSVEGSCTVVDGIFSFDDVDQ
jgi:NAD/NADP transhydrogenase beta subunit